MADNPINVLREVVPKSSPKKAAKRKRQDEYIHVPDPTPPGHWWLEKSSVLNNVPYGFIPSPGLVHRMDKQAVQGRGGRWVWRL